VSIASNESVSQIVKHISPHFERNNFGLPIKRALEADSMIRALLPLERVIGALSDIGNGATAL
jgi:hypothetical protein